MAGPDAAAAPSGEAGEATPTPAPAAARSYPGWVTALARQVLRVFFGRIEVTGASRVPAGRPLLYVANHNNGLVDPILVLGFLPGRPRFLAKNTLWKNPVVRPFLALARVIPVYRPQDTGFDRVRNEASFRSCREVLEAGGAVALFPEGKSHSGPALGELKTGAARIVLGLSPGARRALAVVPVGLFYDAPGRFRSRVLACVGEPLEGAVLADDEAEDARQVRRMTEAIADALEEVTLSHASWDEARLLARVTDLWLQPDPELPVRPPLSAHVAVRRRLLARYRELLATHSERLEPLVVALAAYDELLSAHRLRDEQVGAAYPLPSVLRFVLETTWLMVGRLPLAVVGTPLNYLPYRICGWAGALAAKKPDEPASFMVFGGLLLFPLCWIAEAAWAGWRWGAPAALVVALLAPVAGWAAVRFRDRFRFLAGEARAFLLLHRPGGAGEELRRRRTLVLRELQALAAEVGEAPGAPEAGRAGAGPAPTPE